MKTARRIKAFSYGWLFVIGLTGLKLVRWWDGSTEGVIFAFAILLAEALVIGILWGWHFGLTKRISWL